MSDKHKVLKWVQIKSKNRRIEIVLESLNNEKRFRIFTKRLIDFKTRNITSTHTAYSIESFCFIYDAMRLFFEDSETINKLLLKEINNIKKGTCITNIKID